MLKKYLKNTEKLISLGTPVISDKGFRSWKRKLKDVSYMSADFLYCSAKSFDSMNFVLLDFKVRRTGSNHSDLAASIMLLSMISR